jgi:hypothetical protein
MIFEICLIFLEFFSLLSESNVSISNKNDNIVVCSKFKSFALMRFAVKIRSIILAESKWGMQILRMNILVSGM